MSHCMLSDLGRVRLSTTLWTIAHQAPLSMGFSRQEYWSGLSCPPPGDLPNPELTSKTRKEQVLARIENVEKLESSYTAGGKVDQCRHYGKQFGSLSTN